MRKQLNSPPERRVDRSEGRSLRRLTADVSDFPMSRAGRKRLIGKPPKETARPVDHRTEERSRNRDTNNFAQDVILNVIDVKSHLKKPTPYLYVTYYNVTTKSNNKKKNNSL